MEDELRDLIRGWVIAACREWSYPEVAESYFDAVYGRIPAGVRTLVAAGHRDGLIQPVGGYRFTLQGLPPGKGPYAWVSRNQQAQVPVKERAIDVPGLVDRIGAYGRDGVDVNAPDRGNDALRKAKYLVWYRPLYFSVSAIGLRRDFQVVYAAGDRFVLVDDMIPLG
ncbi:hypothetical protein [Actinomadura bangladeshensis]|uniref:Uncharacterized protein n=1 Tax=Actinomadura bangladeshensis TaxID=453573 RepID=A0A6L9QGN2_9ACTN|nr:hypothetical protein [Actinomadura bangladeshensis]NEA24619.1 hypothetical protein [Actinomadura bangladeshensis]